MRAFTVAAICLLASGCEQPVTSPTPRASKAPATLPDNIAVERDVANIQANVMQAAETQRMNDLERRLSKLENTPEKLDLDLLSTRVQALEAAVGIDSLANATVPVPGPSAAPTTAPRPRPSSTRAATVRPRPSPTSTPRPSERQ